MLDIINEGLRNQNYYICLYKNHIYIYNFEEILMFEEDIIMIKINNSNIKIKGNKMHIKKLENKEILIIGLILGVSYE